MFSRRNKPAHAAFRLSMTEPPPVLIADASVLINLIASHHGSRVLRALPMTVLVTRSAARELRRDNRTGRDDAAAYQVFCADGVLTEIDMPDDALPVFAHLIAGPAQDTLADGEAATIACAIALHATPVIDERKALRLCARDFPSLHPITTTDLFADPAVLSALGRPDLAAAVFFALTGARMRVPEHHFPWIVDLLGPERLAQCLSLPSRIRGGR